MTKIPINHFPPISNKIALEYHWIRNQIPSKDYEWLLSWEPLAYKMMKSGRCLNEYILLIPWSIYIWLLFLCRRWRHLPVFYPFDPEAGRIFFRPQDTTLVRSGFYSLNLSRLFCYPACQTPSVLRKQKELHAGTLLQMLKLLIIFGSCLHRLQIVWMSFCGKKKTTSLSSLRKSKNWWDFR